jgi:mycothiol synthase
MSAHFRFYNGNDETQIIPLWNQCMIRDPIAHFKFRHKILLDENFDSHGFIISENKNTIIGFSLAIRRHYPFYGVGLEEEKGWITIICVNPAFQKKGIGKELLARSEEYLKECGIKQILVSPYTPNYIIPGIDVDIYPAAYELFQNSGYKKNEKVYGMGRSLLDFYPSDDVEKKYKELRKQNIIIKVFEPKYTVGLLEFLRSEYPGELFRTALERLKYSNDNDNIFIALKNEEVIGFSHFVGEHFGPFAIKAEYSGRGVGSCLYYFTAQHMKEKGERNLWLAWTSGRSKDFYYKMGLRVIRRHEIMKKVL